MPPPEVNSFNYDIAACIQYSKLVFKDYREIYEWDAIDDIVIGGTINSALEFVPKTKEK